MSKCLNCNKPLAQTPGKRPRKFCNSTCRSNYWQKQSRIKVSKPKEPIQNVVQAAVGSENEFMGHPIPDGLSGVPLMVWKNDIKKKFKDAKKLPK